MEFYKNRRSIQLDNLTIYSDSPKWSININMNEYTEVTTITEIIAKCQLPTPLLHLFTSIVYLKSAYLILFEYEKHY